MGKGGSRTQQWQVQGVVAAATAQAPHRSHGLTAGIWAVNLQQLIQGRVVAVAKQAAGGGNGSGRGQGRQQGTTGGSGGSAMAGVVAEGWGVGSTG